MGVEISLELKRLTQKEFADVAYEVLRNVFAIHNDYGRFFNERVYKLELAQRLNNVRLELPVVVRHKEFSKRYYLDVVVGDGAIFEFKAADRLTENHVSQLLNYLLLTEMGHGQRIATHSELVDHRFVNTTLTLEDRQRFSVTMNHWDPENPIAQDIADVVVALLRDLGTGLEVSLYEEALAFFLGGDTRAFGDVNVLSNDTILATQRIRLAAPKTAVKITALTSRWQDFEIHAHRLLKHTDLDSIIWINVNLKEVVFTILD